ncbi:hypothetical protein AYO45_03225 [Gammaproteobacteria bacterium SCGC AG-212-F23]|nr:hypothetical protein AYO45_03225 [Gammaproteobacteria bacterium SCGC AG-212-F23]
MITVQLNDKKIILEKNTLLSKTLDLPEYNNKQFAVTLNRQFIPRLQYTTTILNDGDCIDIILPMQGG